MAWMIVRDLIAYEDEPEGTNLNAKGLMGPAEASEDAINRLRSGEGESFRMLDDDSIHYYSGRFLSTEDPEYLMGDEQFQPLLDFGTPNAGATQIQYRNTEGRWETI